MDASNVWLSLLPVLLLLLQLPVLIVGLGGTGFETSLETDFPHLGRAKDTVVPVMNTSRSVYLSCAVLPLHLLPLHLLVVIVVPAAARVS